MSAEQEWTSAKFVQEWFDGLSNRAPIEEVLEFVADQGLEMVFPDRSMHNHAEVRDWYADVGETFSDQSHELEGIVRRDSGDTVELTVTVIWRAKQVADGEQLAARAHQIWHLTKAPAPKGLLIQRYRVEGLDPL